jgi:hypothetical protein
MSQKIHALKALSQRLLFAGCVLCMAMTMIQCDDTPTQPPAQPEVSPRQVAEASTLNGQITGKLPSGADYLISIPAVWNSDLVVYAHGYVAFNEPLKLPDDELEGISISGTVNSLNYAYATTSYRSNGLVIPWAVQDLLDLVTEFKKSWQPRHIFLVGASEGALIATLAIEQSPMVFDGGMPVSGPVGDFRKQIDYFGDFRVVFDYFFPDVLKDAHGVKLPFVVPKSEVESGSWGTTYKGRIETAVATANSHTVEQLLRVTNAAVDPGDPSTAVKTAVDILWYNFFATADAEEKLGGQPFDNTKRFYSRSDNDWKLNFGVGHVQRIAATGNALKNINALCQTSGKLRRPLVTMHTTLDHVVPYWHEPLYTLKTLLRGSFLYHTNLPVVRYGHGTFKLSEVLAGFAVLVLKVTLTDLILAENVLPDAGQRAEFLRLAQENGAHPKIKAVAVAVNK